MGKVVIKLLQGSAVTKR